jgi:hypothetical protein
LGITAEEDVNRSRAMKLIDYPGLRGEWPPPGHSVSSPLRLAPAHCQDVLLQAIRSGESSPATGGLTILTVFNDEQFVRRLPSKDEIFNSVFYEFLNKQRGKTILEIGEMDATFLG